MSLNTILATAPLTTQNYILKATGTTIGNSLIFDNGTNVGINTTSPSTQLHIVGVAGDSFTDGIRVARNGVPSQYGIINYAGGSNNFLAVNTTTGEPAFYWLTSINGTSTTTRMTLNTGSHMLDVNGKGRFTDDLTVNGWVKPNGIYAFTADSGTTYIQQPSGGNMIFRKSDSTAFLTIANSGAATFSSIVGANIAPLANYGLTVKGLYGMWIQRNSVNDSGIEIYHDGTNSIINTSYQSTGSYGGMLIYTGGAERMRITSGGDVFIGTTGALNYTGIAKLNVQQSSASASSFIISNSNASQTAPVISIGSARYTSLSSFTFIQCVTGNSSTDQFVTPQFYVRGDGVIYAQNTSVQQITSDRELKTDIKDYNKGLAEVLAMKPRYFKYKDNLDEEKCGFIAQEMEDAIEGSMVDSSMEGYKTYQVDWYPLLVKAIQELSKQNEELSNRLNKLENK